MSTLRQWDVVEHLNSEEDMALYLEACLEENDPALEDIARALSLDAGTST